MPTLKPLSVTTAPFIDRGEDLPRALPRLEVAVDAAQIDHFDDEGWGYRFDLDTDTLHCLPLPEAKRSISRNPGQPCDKALLPSAKSPDGEILYVLTKDLELEITDLVEGKTWKTKLPELRVHPNTPLRLTMSQKGDQIFIHAGGSHYLNRSQARPTLFVFETNRTPRRKPFVSTSTPCDKDKRKKRLRVKAFDKILDRII